MASPTHQEPQRHGHGGTRMGYVIGFLLSAFLTVVPFWLVMTRSIPSVTLTALIIAIFAFVQIIVHVRVFLHVDTRGEGGWSLISFIFTAIIVLITIGGSIWAMYQMSATMMPTEGMNIMQMP